MIIDLQRRIREAGRIRIGQQVQTQNGKSRPAKLDHFRLTSPDRRAIDQAAGMYGGRPQQWDAPSGRQWEVVTEADELDVIVPPSDIAFSQHYEMWSGGGCQRRCDGVTETIADHPCPCDPEARECSPHTRLSVMLRDLAGLGVWRLDTQGYYAAVELAGAVQVVQAAAGAGVMLPARLRLEQRVVKRPGVGTRRFAVPVLDVEITPAQLLGGQSGGMSLHAGGAAPAGAPVLDAGHDVPDEVPALLTPVPPSVRERPVASVAEQASQVGQSQPQRRKNAAQPIPPTGLQPRTAAEAAAPSGQKPDAGEDLSRLTKPELADRCKQAGLKVSGSKDELLARLAGSDPPDTPPPDDDTSLPPHMPKSITDEQTTRLQILFREHGIRGDTTAGEDLYRATLMAVYKVDSSKHLSRNQASALIDILTDGRVNRHGVEESPADIARLLLEKGAERLDAQDRADVDTDEEDTDG